MKFYKHLFYGNCNILFNIDVLLEINVWCDGISDVVLMFNVLIDSAGVNSGIFVWGDPESTGHSAL